VKKGMATGCPQNCKFRPKCIKTNCVFLACTIDNITDKAETLHARIGYQSVLVCGIWPILAQEMGTGVHRNLQEAPLSLRDRVMHRVS